MAFSILNVELAFTSEIPDVVSKDLLKLRENIALKAVISTSNNSEVARRTTVSFIDESP
jgi:hypothetical protein